MSISLLLHQAILLYICRALVFLRHCYHSNNFLENFCQKFVYRMMTAIIWILLVIKAKFSILANICIWLFAIDYDEFVILYVVWHIMMDTALICFTNIFTVWMPAFFLMSLFLVTLTIGYNFIAAIAIVCSRMLKFYVS